MLQLEELCTKNRERMMEVLHTKNLDVRPPHTASMDTYPDQPPELVPVYITNETVMEVARRLSRGAGPGGMDSVSLQHWILIFGAASKELRLTVADFAEWLVNRWPPWAAYHVLMSSRLTTL